MSSAARAVLVVLCTVVLLAVPAVGSKPVPNAPYVISGPDGAFYARGVPADATGTGGRTDVYAVREPADERVDRYDWYAPSGVTLGWSPIAGKVAVLAVMQPRPAARIAGQAMPDWQTAEQLRFALGGRVLKSYTNADLIALGAEKVVSRPAGQRASYKVIGCE
ncbi:MAG: hypothetical protein JWO31_698, partial [Phycisphaerales bacterium]|nr:hypothetical protein [Phycisphaerales bacterium]